MTDLTNEQTIEIATLGASDDEKFAQELERSSAKDVLLLEFASKLMTKHRFFLKTDNPETAPRFISLAQTMGATFDQDDDGTYLFYRAAKDRRKPRHTCRGFARC
jgi:hypothetical protein